MEGKPKEHQFAIRVAGKIKFRYERLDSRGGKRNETELLLEVWWLSYAERRSRI
jgi:hypothetical protein